MRTATTTSGSKAKKNTGKTNKSGSSRKKVTATKNSTPSPRAGASAASSTKASRSQAKKRNSRKGGAELEKSSVEKTAQKPSPREEGQSNFGHLVQKISKNLRATLDGVDGNIKKKPYTYVLGALGVGVAIATAML